MRLNSGVVYIDNEIIEKQKQFLIHGNIDWISSFIPGYTGFQKFEIYQSITIKISMKEIYHNLFKGLDLNKKKQ